MHTCAHVSATCYVALMILRMAFINVEWKLPSSTKELLTEAFGEGELFSWCFFAFLVTFHKRIKNFHHQSFKTQFQFVYFQCFSLSLGRCECHGHADHCDTSVTLYRCLCLPESHTKGNNVSNKQTLIWQITTTLLVVSCG